MICKSCGASKFKESYDFMLNEKVFTCEYCGSEIRRSCHKESQPVHVPVPEYPYLEHRVYYPGMGVYYSDHTNLICTTSTSTNCTFMPVSASSSYTLSFV